MNGQEPSPVPKIVVIVAASLVILYGLISTCTGGLGLISSIGLIAGAGGDFLTMGIVSAVLEGLDVITCLVMVLVGIIALIKRGLGRWLLVAVLLLALVVDVVVYAGGLVNTYLFLGGAIGPMIVGSVVGLVTTIVKAVVYLIVAAVVLFLGKERPVE